MMESVPCPVLVYDADGRMLQVSQALTKITGYMLEEIPTRRAWAQFAYSEPDAAKLTHHVGTVFETLKPVAVGDAAFGPRVARRASGSCWQRPPVPTNAARRSRSRWRATSPSCGVLSVQRRRRPQGEISRLPRSPTNCARRWRPCKAPRSSCSNGRRACRSSNVLRTFWVAGPATWRA